MTILIAEDEAMMLAALKQNLETDGYTVIACTDGQAAIDEYQRSKPDLIITDILMPYTSGLELIAMAKSHPERKTPIIVLSGMGQEATVIEAFNLGADDFITKPFNPTELTLRVQRLLKQK